MGKDFEFDRVFSPSEGQSVVFDEVEGLVTSVLEGYNVAILAYGQTGSGKTFTMEGPQEDPGVNLRALAELFRSVRVCAQSVKQGVGFGFWVPPMFRWLPWGSYGLAEAFS